MVGLRTEDELGTYGLLSLYMHKDILSIVHSPRNEVFHGSCLADQINLILALIDRWQVPDHAGIVQTRLGICVSVVCVCVGKQVAPRKDAMQIFFICVNVTQGDPVWTIDIGDGHELVTTILSDIFGLRRILGVSLWPVYLHSWRTAQCTQVKSVFN